MALGREVLKPARKLYMKPDRGQINCIITNMTMQEFSDKASNYHLI